MKEIDIKEDINHQKLAWKIRKIGFIAIFILVILALSGLFGSGFLSSAEAGNDHMKINFERFIRAGGPAEIKFDLKDFKDSLVSVFINNSYTKNIQIEKISPAPEEEIGGSSFTEFIFKVNTDDKNSQVKMNYTAKATGIFKADIIYQGSTFSFNQIIYP